MANVEVIAPNQTGLTPWQIIQRYTSGQWEAFIDEWMDGFTPQYVQVVCLAGPGDKGRDVMGYVTDPTDPQPVWDNYQCKHIAHPLQPGDIYVELGKLCVYTYQVGYTAPRNYRFVSPFGVGPALHDLLKNPDKLKTKLIENWKQSCEAKIAAQTYPLVGGLKSYVEDFDFGIVWFLTRAEILGQHQRTAHWYRRFKIEPPTRPQPEPVPERVQPHELTYTTRLMEAYADHLRRPTASAPELKDSPQLLDHFRRSRGYFFSAESLARFSRDNFEPGAFDVLKRHIYDGVIDVACGKHADGYECVQKVTQASVAIQLPQSDLAPHLWPSDRKGICHHLSNDGRLSWVTA